MGKGRLAWGIALLAAALACTTVEEGDGGIGTTSGSGTTTGGTAGTPDNTVCLDNGNGSTAAADEFAPCGLNRDCICPLACLTDPARLSVLGPSGPDTKFCERGCSTNADCPLPSEVCVPRGDGGVCLEIPCGPILPPDGGLLNGDLGQVCNALATGDGTCIPNAVPSVSDPLYDGGGTTVVIANGMPSACWLAGTSASACVLTALPTDSANRCPPGKGCALLVTDGTSPSGICVAACDPAASGQCGSGTECKSTPVLDSASGALGFCYGAGSGGCLSGQPPSQTELFLCNATDDCGCPDSCTAAPAGGGWCTRSCSGTADCPNPSTGCVGGVCGYLPCGAQPLGACNYLGTNDGTCLAPAFSWAALAPYCVAAGNTAQGSRCSLESPEGVSLVSTTYVPKGGVTFVSVPASNFCSAGLLCVDDGSGQGTGRCRPACNDQITPGSCGSGTCDTLDPSGFGFCHP